MTSNTALLESFVRDARKTVALLEELSQKALWWDDEKDMQRFIITIHGIKSSLASIGETGLSNTASVMEESGRDKISAIITSSIPGFLNELTVLLKKTEQETAGGVEITGEDSEDIYEKISAIKETCSDYNRRGALELIASVNSCTERTNEVLECIKEHVVHSDFEEAEAAAASYLDELLCIA